MIFLKALLVGAGLTLGATLGLAVGAMILVLLRVTK